MRNRLRSGMTGRIGGGVRAGTPSGGGLAPATNVANQTTADIATHTQRGPTASMNGPAVSIASESITKLELMITVNARPRTASGAPRWMSRTFVTKAAPLPSPDRTMAADATQTFGDSATRSEADAIAASARG